MPFTPFHMGPGILVKALLRGSFSLMVFGWAQIIQDIQPLVVLITGEGRLHGFTHTFVGATLLGIFSALTGKGMSEWGLRILFGPVRGAVSIAWWVVWLSAFTGTYSHILLDGIMHLDMTPLQPFSNHNPLLGLISVSALHKLCVYTGIVGGVVYFVGNQVLARRATVAVETSSEEQR